MKFKIFVFAFNRPDLLKLQVASLRKFVKNPHEIFIIHDSRNNEFVDHFKAICEKLKVNFFHKNSLLGKTPSEYHSDSIQWAYKNIILKNCIDDIIMILDHDMFLIDDFDAIQYMQDCDIAGCLQKRGNVKYFWPGLTILNMKKIHSINFDFSSGYYQNQLLDTGGGTSKLFENSTLKYKDTGVEYPDDYNGIDLTNPSVSNGFEFELHLNGKFLHSRNACSWHKNMQVDDLVKTKTLITILNDFIEVTEKNG